MDYNALRAAIDEARKKTGMSFRTLAERVGKDERHIRRVLDPDHSPQPQYVEEVAKAMHLKVTYGLTGTPS